MTGSLVRSRVLGAYRRILVARRDWAAVDEADTTRHQAFILQEARQLFRKNSQVRRFCLDSQIGGRDTATCSINYVYSKKTVTE